MPYSLGLGTPVENATSARCLSTSFAYVVADAAGIIGYEVGIALFAALLGVVYLIAVGVGWIRYR